MRLKLGHELARRDVAPHVYESDREATAELRRSLLQPGD